MNTHYLPAKYLLAGCLACSPLTVNASDHAANAGMQAIARVLGEYGGPDKPALAIALLQDGKVIYENAFGNANLEYKVAATVDTKFQVDSLAWEFIAAAILMLEDRGQLALDDDIRKYLPQLPDLGKKISINHLLSSTDGLYGVRVMKSLAGWESKEPERYETILPLLTGQKTPNFHPGAAFSPGGDTRLILLMKIVERVSGQSFEAYCKDYLFSPLKMANTLFLNENSEPVNNVAVPYLADAKGLYKPTHAGGKAAGPIDLYSTIRDLSIWRSAMSSTAPGKTSLAARLNLPVRLDSGAVVRDISGISTYGQLHAGSERGIPKFYRTGNSGGYASSLFHFPDQNVTAIALSSGLAYNGNYAMRIASIVLKNHFTEAETIDYTKIAGVKVAPELLRQYTGNYWNGLRAIAAQVHVKDGVLHYTRTQGADGRAAIPLSESLFQLKIDGDDRYTIKFVDKKDGRDMHFIMGDSDPLVFESYTPASYSESALAQFAGTYYCKELNSSFVLETRGGLLTARNIRVGTVVFKPITADLFSGNKDFMGSIKFNRSKSNDVIGFRILVDEVRGLEFRKIPMGEDSKPLHR
ncbi:beta-lactamase family protein [Massilia violaceinigra]|uniref:Beta-lactamase family protein n=1 Tax=Massilia violaceinigra TaxID=2045208 RepID=A0ABY4A2V9_9BURK|nr:serine hydrolase domain-containing protein [Massilia violaceinigra]UOD29095.1 beta-lactamase family protein [Massilia violaceinigra]